jgi:ABC-type uncharacterized transport system substrate-binding protein
MLKEFVPALARVAVLYNPEDRNKAWEYKQIEEAARTLKLTVRAFEARSATEIDKAFARMADDHSRALVIFADALMVFHEKMLADLALQNRLRHQGEDEDGFQRREENLQGSSRWL